MDQSILKVNDQIKAEADELLYEKKLFNILQKYGTVHITGSYSLNLMTWRDLDIYLEVTHHSEKDFFSLGFQISDLLHPVRMHFRNELIAQTDGLPFGLYWGIYFGDERAGAWKIDIWSVKTEECKRLLDHCTVIKSKLTPAKITHIMDIKSKCWRDPLYRKTYHSGDIYDAVLEKNIQDIEGFREFLKMRGNS